MYTQMPQWGQALQSNTWQQPQQGAMPDQQAMPQQQAPAFGYSPTPLSQFGWQAMMGGIAPWLDRFMPQQLPQQAAPQAQAALNRRDQRMLDRVSRNPRFAQRVLANPSGQQYGLLNSTPPPGSSGAMPSGGWAPAWSSYIGTLR